MNRPSFIPVFTPSQAPPEDLEKIFVQRHELLGDAVDRVRESAHSGNKHHLLFVGPRGSGKTHFVSLLVHRITLEPDLESKLAIAWLNEDETSTSFLDLLIKIYEALSKRYPSHFSADDIEPLYDKEPLEAEEFLGSKLLAQVGERVPVVVVENLDSLFESIGDEGQKKLRAYLQEHPVFAFVATAQALIEDLTSRNGPFFGFFQTEHLIPLNFKEASELLGKIANKNHNRELSAFLATAKGRSRVRALHFLSGGNHRIFVVLSQFITRDNIEDLVVPFKKMVDELTPYYQERVRSLSPLQRKIVEFLCKSAETVPVKEISRRMLTTPQTVSSQLKDLRAKGYVRSHSKGRESLYEIAEPLMRICVEVKENQNYGPLRLLVDFIRVWYESEELTKRKESSAQGSLARSYYEAAIEKLATEGNLRQKLLVGDLQVRFSERMAPDQLSALDALNDAPEALAPTLTSEGIVGLAEIRARQGQWIEAFDQLESALQKGREITPRHIVDLEELLEILFDAGQGKAALDSHVRRFLRVALDQSIPVELGEALVRHLGTLAQASDMPDPAWLARWGAVWETASKDIPELAISMRMFRFGIEFLCSPDRDESILLRLRSEERTLLRKSLGLAPKDA